MCTYIYLFDLIWFFWTKQPKKQEWLHRELHPFVREWLELSSWDPVCSLATKPGPLGEWKCALHLCSYHAPGPEIEALLHAAVWALSFTRRLDVRGVECLQFFCFLFWMFWEGLISTVVISRKHRQFFVHWCYCDTLHCRFWKTLFRWSGSFALQPFGSCIICLWEWVGTIRRGLRAGSHPDWNTRTDSIGKGCGEWTSARESGACKVSQLNEGTFHQRSKSCFNKNPNRKTSKSFKHLANKRYIWLSFHIFSLKTCCFATSITSSQPPFQVCSSPFGFRGSTGSCAPSRALAATSPELLRRGSFKPRVRLRHTAIIAKAPSKSYGISTLWNQWLKSEKLKPSDFFLGGDGSCWGMQRWCTHTYIIYIYNHI